MAQPSPSGKEYFSSAYDHHSVPYDPQRSTGLSQTGSAIISVICRANLHCTVVMHADQVIVGSVVSVLIVFSKYGIEMALVLA